MESGRKRSLRVMLGVQLAVLIGGPLLVAGVAAGMLLRSGSDYSAAAVAYRDLTRAFEIAGTVRATRERLAATELDLNRARIELDAMLSRLGDLPRVGPSLRRASGHLAAGDIPRARISLDQAMAALAAHARNLEVEITQAETQARARQRTALLALVGAALGFALLATFVALVQYRTIARPVEKLTGVVRRARGRELPRLIDATGPAELHDLAREFNRMARELEALYSGLESQVQARTQELIRSARLASVGVLAAGVAHEINNPLSIITGFGERALRLKTPPPSEEVASALRVIVEEAYRCKSITDKLLSLARPDVSVPTGMVRLDELVADAITKVRVIAQRRTILFDPPARPLHVRGQPGPMLQVCLNLLINAVEATSPADGSIRVSLGSEGRYALLSIEDNGAGMTPETVAKVFEPFFTLKRDESRPGLGLGLSIVQAIVSDHQGSIKADSPGLGLGSRFELRLPLANEESEEDGQDQPGHPVVEDTSTGGEALARQ